MKNIKSVNKMYNESSKNKNDHQKVIWGSKIGMINRYKLLFKLLKKNKINKWLDIGCGTGLIFKYEQKYNNNINFKVGIELNRNLYNFAKKSKYKKKTHIINKDFMKFKSKEKFDLITMIGVLQNCGYSYIKMLKQIKKFLKKNSVIFLTSKNLLCENINQNEIHNSGHEWFDPRKISKYMKKNGFQIIKVNAFNFYKNKTKDFKKSENFFIYAKYSK
jgi:predicted TPR repeat methyltransferase